MMLTSQEPKSLPTSQRLSLRDAFAWLVASSLHLIGTILWIIGRLLNHQDFSPALLFHPIFFAIALNAWRRVRRGEGVRDVLASDAKNLRRVVIGWLIVIGIATATYFALLLIPREETNLKHLGVLFWGAAYLIIAAILWKRLRKLSRA